MKSNCLTLNNQQPLTNKYRWIDKIAKHIFIAKFKRINNGHISITEANNKYSFGSSNDVLQSHITVFNPSFYSDVIFGGTVGAGEAYMAQSWNCDDLTRLVQIILKNEDVLNSIDGGVGKFITPLHKAFHFLHRNTLTGSRKNIEAHYDLGNEMFELFLDPTMMYSSGVFEHENMTMEQASIAKLDRICKKLQLNSNDHVLEIGSGWGGFAIYAAKQYGCKITTTTISQQQYDYTLDKIQQYGLEDKITILCEDYRLMKGKYDKIVSIEMIEAVGHAYYKTYFEQCSKLLKNDGMMLLQSITIADQRYHIAKKEVDFIQRYIFPGGCLPSVEVIANTVSKHTDMRFFHLEDIGPDYATTLFKWRERFFNNLSQVKELGYSDTFIRMWEFYLCYCEGGFHERGIGTIQLLLTKPETRRNACITASKAIQ